MLKRLSAISLVLSVMIIFTGCSSSGNPAEGDSTSNQPTANKEKVTLKIGLPGSYEVTSKEIIDGFIASHPDINVEIQEAPWGRLYVQDCNANCRQHHARRLDPRECYHT